MYSKEAMIPIKDVSEILSKVSNEMDKMKKQVVKKEEYAEPIKEIKNCLKKIDNELEKINDIDNYMKHTYAKIIKNIDEQKAVIDAANVDIMVKARNETIEMIKVNLPDNMLLKPKCNDTWQLYRSTNVIKNKKNIREETYLGEMYLTIEDHLTVIKVMIEGAANKIETIRLESAYKIYPVVSYIRMHCDYGEV